MNLSEMPNANRVTWWKNIRVRTQVGSLIFPFEVNNYFTNRTFISCSWTIEVNSNSKTHRAKLSKRWRLLVRHSSLRASRPSRAFWDNRIIGPGYFEKTHLQRYWRSSVQVTPDIRFHIHVCNYENHIYLLDPRWINLKTSLISCEIVC